MNGVSSSLLTREHSTSSFSSSFLHSRHDNVSDSSSSDGRTLVPSLYMDQQSQTSPFLVPFYGPDIETRPRTLVLCFDGTRGQFNNDNSNVIKFVSALKKDDCSQQLVYYQTGIGTYTKSILVAPVLLQVSELLDAMFAWNLSSHVMQGYEFLMQNYVKGDKICIFGFSRGAYTARALAGMIQKVGLLPPCNKEQIPFAWAMYQREDPEGLKASFEFKNTFSNNVIIDFVGVWDTVESVGLTDPDLPFTRTNSIRYFRHALSLDEHRVKFLPNFYHVPMSWVNSHWNRSGQSETAKQELDIDEYEEEVYRKTGIKTDAEEVWFAGCHCDIGGGSVRNDTRYSLARIPLRWMIRECFRAKTGIIFDVRILRDIGLDWRTVYPEIEARPPRCRPSPNMKIEEPEFQGFAATFFVKLFACLLFLPFQIFIEIVIYPFKSLWLIIRYSDFVKPVASNFSSQWISTKKYFGCRPKYKVNVNREVSVRRPDFVSEEVEELNDALSAMYDQLSIRWFWWLLEILPLRHITQNEGRDDFYVRINLGRGRQIYGNAKQRLKVHRSVKTRMEARGNPTYNPRSSYELSEGRYSSKWNLDEDDDKSDWKVVS